MSHLRHALEQIDRRQKPCGQQGPCEGHRPDRNGAQSNVDSSSNGAAVADGRTSSDVEREVGRLVQEVSDLVGRTGVDDLLRDFTEGPKIPDPVTPPPSADVAELATRLRDGSLIPSDISPLRLGNGRARGERNVEVVCGSSANDLPGSTRLASAESSETTAENPANATKTFPECVHVEFEIPLSSTPVSDESILFSSWDAASWAESLPEVLPAGAEVAEHGSERANRQGIAATGTDDKPETLAVEVADAGEASANSPSSASTAEPNGDTSTAAAQPQPTLDEPTAAAVDEKEPDGDRQPLVTTEPHADPPAAATADFTDDRGKADWTDERADRQDANATEAPAANLAMEATEAPEDEVPGTTAEEEAVDSVLEPVGDSAAPPAEQSGEPNSNAPETDTPVPIAPPTSPKTSPTAASTTAAFPPPPTYHLPSPQDHATDTLEVDPPLPPKMNRDQQDSSKEQCEPDLQRTEACRALSPCAFESRLREILEHPRRRPALDELAAWVSAHPVVGLGGSILVAEVGEHPEMTIATAAFAAVQACHTQRPVLLVDGDAVDCKISLELEQGTAPGWTDLLDAPESMTEIVRRTNLDHLFFLPAGRYIGQAVDRDGLGRLLSRLRHRWPLVIVAGGGEPSFTKAAFASCCDLTLLAVCYGHTRAVEVEAASRNLKAHGSRIGGIMAIARG